MVKKNKTKKLTVTTVVLLAYAIIALGFCALILFTKSNPRVENPGVNWSLIYFILFSILCILVATSQNNKLESDRSESGKQRLLHIRLWIGAPFILLPFIIAFLAEPIEAAEFVHSFLGLTRAPGGSISPEQLLYVIQGLPLTLGLTAWLLYEDKITEPSTITRLLLLFILVPVGVFATLMLSFARHFGS